MGPHEPTTREIPVAEVDMALETAFMKFSQFGTLANPLVEREAVVYRDATGHIHPGPFMVVSVDAATVLIRGIFDGRPGIGELRVLKTELVRFEPLREEVHRILSEAYPCPHCQGKDPSRPAGTDKPPRRTDN